ncbi:MAG: helix-turn-helix transcriptional regulator [Ruminococcus sp.]
MRPDISERLKKARIERGISQEQAAKRIGVKRSTIGNYENGVSSPDVEKFIELCNMYNLDYVKLLVYYYGSPVECHSSGNDIISDIVYLISTFDTHKLEELRWIFSGEHGKRVDPLIQLVLIYLHLDIGSRIHATEWLFGVYTTLKMQKRDVNSGIMEPDISNILASLEDAKQAYFEGKENY